MANSQTTPERKRVPSGLYQKPIRRKGGLIGSRELTTGLDAESTLTIPQQEKGAIRVLFFRWCRRDR